MHVANIQPFAQPAGSRYRVGAQITIQDAGGAAVPGATVTIEVTPPSGPVQSVDRVTAANGRATLSLRTNKLGTWTFCVTNVAKDGWAYDSGANAESCDAITIP
jgi:hypothetical protein